VDFQLTFGVDRDFRGRRHIPAIAHVLRETAEAPAFRWFAPAIEG
jgi:hypothetical protein